MRSSIEHLRASVPRGSQGLTETMGANTITEPKMYPPPNLAASAIACIRTVSAMISRRRFAQNEPEPV